MDKLVYGHGNNDLFAATPNVTSGTVPIVSNAMSIADGDIVTAMLCTTDANGVYGGPTGTGLAGSWKIEVSNNAPLQSEQGFGYGQSTDANNPNGIFVDITGNFVREPKGAQWGAPLAINVADPTLGIPNASGAGTAYPIRIINAGWREIRFTFTPSAGQGANARAAVFFVVK